MKKDIFKLKKQKYGSSIIKSPMHKTLSSKNAVLESFKYKLENHIDKLLVTTQSNRYFKFNLELLADDMDLSYSKSSGDFLFSQNLYLSILAHFEDLIINVSVSSSLIESKLPSSSIDENFLSNNLFNNNLIFWKTDKYFVKHLSNKLYLMNKYSKSYTPDLIHKTLFYGGDIIKDKLSVKYSAMHNSDINNYVEKLFDIENNLTQTTFASLWDGKKVLDKALTILEGDQTIIYKLLKQSEKLPEIKDVDYEILAKRLTFIKK